VGILKRFFSEQKIAKNKYKKNVPLNREFDLPSKKYYKLSTLLCATFLNVSLAASLS